MSATLARIGINALFLEPGMGGLETYVKELVPPLAALVPDAEVTVLANPVGGPSLAAAGWSENVAVHVPRVIGTAGIRAISETTVLGLLADRRLDGLFNVALMGPLWMRQPNVVKIADVTWLRDFDPGRRPTSTERLWGALVPRVARRADRVAAMTEFGALEIAEALRVPREQIDVVGSGCGVSGGRRTVDEAAVRERHGLGDGPVVLNLGAKKPHKNHLRLIDAMRHVREAVPDATLVLPGPPTPREQDLYDHVRQLGLDDVVRFPGFIDDAAVEELYAVAACFAFPSLSEGFGLPILEAMSRDVPVVTSDVSCLPEVAGGAAVLVDPYSDEAIAAGVISVLTDADLRGRLMVAGRIRSADFTWERCAERVLASIGRAADAVRAR